MTVPLIEIDTGDAGAGLLAAFKALGEPRRFQILRCLMRAELCVCELIDELGMAQPLASHHLGALRRVGLIRARREGQWMYYSVNPDTLSTLARAFGALFDPSSLPPAAQYGASSACAGVPRHRGA